MFPLLAGVLAAGNVCFDDHGDGNAATVVQTPDSALTRTAACLGVDAAALEAALTSVTLLVGGRGGSGSDGGSRSGSRSGSRDASSWIGGGSGSRSGSRDASSWIGGGSLVREWNFRWCCFVSGVFLLGVVVFFLRAGSKDDRGEVRRGRESCGCARPSPSRGYFLVGLPGAGSFLSSGGSVIPLWFSRTHEEFNLK